MKIKNKRIKRDLDKYADAIVYNFCRFPYGLPYGLLEACVKDCEANPIITLLMMTIPKKQRHQYTKKGKWKLSDIPAAGKDSILLIYVNEKLNKELNVEICKHKRRWKYRICQHDPKISSLVEFESVFLALESPLSGIK